MYGHLWIPFLEEGKLMGLASYGTDRYVKEMWKCVAVKEDGGREINFPQEEFFDFIRTLKKSRWAKIYFR